MTCKTLTYLTLLQMRQNALWAIEATLFNGIKSEALRYLRIMNYIENRMYNFEV